VLFVGQPPGYCVFIWDPGGQFHCQVRQSTITETGFIKIPKPHRFFLFISVILLVLSCKFLLAVFAYESNKFKHDTADRFFHSIHACRIEYISSKPSAGMVRGIRRLHYRQQDLAI
jgi:hypothetical protein